jgi:hypothetical protein
MRRKKKMNVESIITEQEYNSIRQVSYKDFTVYTMRLVKLCVEESLKTLPSVINHLSRQASYLKDLSDAFYDKNKDLIDHKPLVASVIESIEIENPGLKYGEILEKAAPEARRKIEILSKIKDQDRRPLTEYDSKLKEL